MWHWRPVPGWVFQLLPTKLKAPRKLLATFLGIELDTRAGEVRLPKEKLTRLQREIRVWDGRRSCTKRELLSLIGQLQHASSMVRSGHTFLRHMITLSAVPKELHHRMHRPSLVECIHRVMEREEHDVRDYTRPLQSHHHIGCLRFLGVQSIFITWGLVPAGVARVMEKRSHYQTGTPTSSGGSGTVG